MDIKIAGPQRANLRTDVLVHRSKSSLNDVDYARSVLHVSLNTFKKCIGGDPELILKQRTFNTIVANIGGIPKRFGVVGGGALPPSEFGGYAKADYDYLVGRYILYRRAIDNGHEITRAVLDISWTESLACLSFVETRRFNTDGKWRSSDFKGNIYMHAERVLMGLLAIDNGDTRLTLLHIPTRHVSGSVFGGLRSSGVVLTHGYPKRFFQPVVSPVTIEAIPSTKKSMSANAICITLAPGAPDYARAAEDLRVAEEHAVVMTPLMWRDAQK
jgi:hypothetical protein